MCLGNIVLHIQQRIRTDVCICILLFIIYNPDSIFVYTRSGATELDRARRDVEGEVRHVGHTQPREDTSPDVDRGFSCQGL
jgi:hypothetical protein